MMLKPLSSMGRKCVALTFAGSVVMSVAAQQPSPPRPRGVPKPPDPGPLFFSEHWRNPKTYKADALPLTSQVISWTHLAVSKCLQETKRL